jgi:hypothetical protein
VASTVKDVDDLKITMVSAIHHLVVEQTDANS